MKPNLNEIASEIIEAKEKIVVIMGRSGVGKTTLLRIIKDISGDDARFMESKYLIFEGTIQDNIMLGRKISKDLQKYLEIIFKTEKKLQNTKEIINKNVISTGQIQRISLLRDIIESDDKIIIIDEPTSAIDSENENGVAELINLKFEQMKIRKLIITTHSKNLYSKLNKAKLILLND